MEAVEFTFCLPFTGDFLHELSNEGARRQFERYLQDILLPVMVEYTGVSEITCQH